MLQTKEQNSPQNIFSTPLTKGDKKKSAKEEILKRNHKKAYASLFLAFLLIGVYSWMVFYPRLQSYLKFDQNLNAINQQIESVDVQLASLEEERDLHKSAYDEAFKEDQEIIDTVFPKKTEKIEVIRLLEDFSAYLSATYGDFEFTSITFSKVEVEVGNTVLPFQTSIHASKANFDRFLGLINLSGSLDPDSEHIRLMEISNITLRYRGPDATGKDQGVDFNVKLKAYSQS